MKHRVIKITKEGCYIEADTPFEALQKADDPDYNFELDWFDISTDTEIDMN